MKLEELKWIIKEIIVENFRDKQTKMPFPDYRDREPEKPDGFRKRIWDKDRKPAPTGNKKIYDDRKTIADPDRHYKKKGK